MDDENRILTHEEFQKMNADLEKELAGRDYHNEMKEALDIAINALARIESIHFYDSEYSTTISREMEEVARVALKKVREFIK